MKYVVIYRVPTETMKKWMADTPPEELKKQGEEIGKKMTAWMEKNKAHILDNGLPLGKNTRMTAQQGGEPTVESISNDLNAYIVIEADSIEQVTEMFKDNPQMEIPTAYLDIMAVTHA